MTPSDSFPQAVAQLLALSDLVRPMAIRAAASLRLADHIEAGASTVEELAHRTSAAPRPLRALVGVLVELGLLQSVPHGSLALTDLGLALSSRVSPLALTLDTDGPVGRYDLSIIGLADTVRTGAAAFETLFGQTYWEYVASSPERSSTLGMMQPSTPMLDADVIVAGTDWSGSNTVLDVGGANGALLVSILNRHPHLTGAVFDLPGLRQNAVSTFELCDPSRADYIDGDFLRHVPIGFDTYVLSAVLYDWDDTRSIQLLRNLADVPRSPRILISEVSLQLPGTVRDHRLDLQMYCGASGFERSPEEVIQLAAQVGLEPIGEPRQAAQRFVIEFQGGRNLR